MMKRRMLGLVPDLVLAWDRDLALALEWRLAPEWDPVLEWDPAPDRRLPT